MERHQRIGAFPLPSCPSPRCSSHRLVLRRLAIPETPLGEGETEFIWQKLRVQPEAGKCLIWPTQFTHTHRGNPVYSTNKYIATGWYTYDW